MLITDNASPKSDELNKTAQKNNLDIKGNIQIEEQLSDKMYIATVDKEAIKNLNKNGLQVVQNNHNYIIPLVPNAGEYEDDTDSEVVHKNILSDNVNDMSKILSQIKSTGKNVGVAILDTGLAPHPDIKDNIAAFVDMVNGKKEMYDDNGHATHIAGIIAGQGTMSEGKYKGLAPDSKLIGVKVLDSDGGAKISDIIKGIDWVIENKDKYNIKVINMSIGIPSAGYAFDPIHKAVERATKEGILVVAAAGNEGPNAGTIGGSPGNSPYTLTVGALNDRNTQELEDDLPEGYSSRGPTVDGLEKPDVMAKGNDVISLNISGSQIDKIAKAVKYLRELPDEKLKDLPPELFKGLGLQPGIVKESNDKIRQYLGKNLPNITYVNEYYVAMPGSSMAAPFGAATAADMYEVNPKLKPEVTKDIIKKTADNRGWAKFIQGTGSIDPVEATQIAAETKADEYIISGQK
jgi:subtilisin family serine protease